MTPEETEIIQKAEAIKARAAAAKEDEKKAAGYERQPIVMLDRQLRRTVGLGFAVVGMHFAMNSNLLGALVYGVVSISLLFISFRQD